MIQTKCWDLNFVEVLKTMKNHFVILNVGTVRDGPQIITEGESKWRLGTVGSYVVFATVWARVRAPTTPPPRTIRAFVAVGNKARDPCN